MKSLRESLFDSKTQTMESLFDTDLVSDEIGTLYDWFGGHIKKFSKINSVGLGWTHYFDQPAVVREWKKEGRPELKGGFAKTTFPPDLQKFIAVILNNITISKKQLIGLDKDGVLDTVELNDFLGKTQILNPPDTKWGASDAYHTIGARISYIEGTPMQFRNVGIKEFKGLSTENIEIAIYTVDKSGIWSHRWVLLTDLSVKNIKQS